ncbi:MAG: CPBP family intramembrane metalloprotease [Bacteroidales bacterium]|jgi:membrane protease YdiL (CAAX protease family)|nr:CPBP family intramembrane metalloprotease [Bacteroidales bacterium]
MKKAIQFIVLTCLLSWAIAGVAIGLGLRKESGLMFVVLGAVYMLLPAICAIILQKVHKEKPFKNLNISFRFNRWFLVAGIVPILLAFMTLGINLLFPNVSFSANYEGLLSTLPAEQAAHGIEQLSKIPPAVFLLTLLVLGIIAGYTINALFAFGEELGWRGYLLKALREKKFLFVSLITGFVWGLWHFPLILIGHNYPQHPIIGVGMMTVWCILLSPVMTYIVIKSKSVITAAIFHGTVNAVAGISLCLAGGNDLTNGVTGLAGFLALLLISITFFLYDKCVTKENIFTKEIGEY